MVVGDVPNMDLASCLVLPSVFLCSSGHWYSIVPPLFLPFDELNSAIQSLPVCLYFTVFGRILPTRMQTHTQSVTPTVPSFENNHHYAKAGCASRDHGSSSRVRDPLVKLRGVEWRLRSEGSIRGNLVTK